MDGKTMNRKTITELDNVITYQVYRAGRLLRFFLQNKLQIDKEHLSPEQFFILFRLYMKDGQNQRNLADRILNDHPNITRLLVKLEKRGYIKRKADMRDGRSISVTLSAKGRRLCESSVPLIQEVREKILQGIDKDDIRVFQKMLKQVEKNITP
jgi:DNA-binding MarR family transcriptional regulator